MSFAARAYVADLLARLAESRADSPLGAEWDRRFDGAITALAEQMAAGTLAPRGQRAVVDHWLFLQEVVANEPELGRHPHVADLLKLGRFLNDLPDGFAWDWLVVPNDRALVGVEVGEGVVIDEFFAAFRARRCGIVEVDGRCLVAVERPAAHTVGMVTQEFFDGDHAVVYDSAARGELSDPDWAGALGEERILGRQHGHALACATLDFQHPQVGDLLDELGLRPQGLLLVRCQEPVQFEAWCAWFAELVQELQTKARARIRDLVDCRTWQDLFGASDPGILLLDELWEYAHWIGAINGNMPVDSMLLYAHDRLHLCDYLCEEVVEAVEGAGPAGG